MVGQDASIGPVENEPQRPPESTPVDRKRFWGLIRQRPGWVLTWRGRIFLLAAATTLLVMIGRNLGSFLTVSAPVSADVLVVEGWLPDYALDVALQEFRSRGCHMLYVTGGPLEAGYPFAEHQTYAERGLAGLIRQGLAPEMAQAVPAPATLKDRTYGSAVALRKWLQDHGIHPGKFNVVSIGPHARRTRLLFRKAFGSEAQIGIIAVEDRDYEPKRWWQSSQGVQAVLDELAGYGYARFFFRAPKP